MIADRYCLDCGEHVFRLGDAAWRELKPVDSSRDALEGAHYFKVVCPECLRRQGLVVTGRPRDFMFTLWPCTWNDEPCAMPGCVYCGGEYV